MSPLGRPFAKLIAALGLVELRSDQFREDVANRLRRGQLRGTIEQMRIMLLGNTFFAPALSFQAWNIGANEVVIAWTLGTVLYSWWLCFSWSRMYHTNGSARDMRWFLVETFFNSFLWTLGMALFYPIVEGEQKTVIATIIVGSLALGTMGFSRAPSVGVTYLSVQTVGNTLVALVCGLTMGSNADLLIAMLSLLAGITLFTATLERGKSALEAFKNHEGLSEKSEVIELLLKDYEEQATEWLWQTDQNGSLLSAPVQVTDLFGLSPGKAENKNLFDALAEKCTAQSRDDVERLRSAFQNQVDFHDVRLSIEDPKSGEVRWILMKGRPQFAHEVFTGFRGIFADATESVKAERKVRFLAAYDSLTELLNRNSVQKRLSELAVADGFSVGLFIDLDGFKQVNDSYGHHIGDLLLKEVAERLRTFESAQLWGARLGGDEFFVLLTRETPIDANQARWIAEDICDRLSEPVRVSSFNLQISASVGIARFPEDTKQGPELLSLADMALYEAKESGRDRVVFFNIDMQNRLNRRMAIIERLKIAVRNQQILPYYQPQHALSDRRLIGFEALARWDDEELGTIGPDVFIPIAEQSGLIVELGEQLLRTACQDAHRWSKELAEVAPVVSVNFSPLQFANSDMTALISKVLKETGLAPNLLEVEVTEGVLIANKEKIAATLAELSDLGISIALDDFGTGYSSLSYLKELPLNRLKIDRTFVSGTDGASPGMIAETIIQLGHNLGLSIIAEGVEDQQQVDLLERMGCDDAQGYFFGRPQPVELTNELVAERKREVLSRMAG